MNQPNAHFIRILKEEGVKARFLLHQAIHVTALSLCLWALPLELQATPLTLRFDSPTPEFNVTQDYLENGFRMSVLSNHYDLRDGILQIDTHGDLNRVCCSDNPTIRFDHFGKSFDVVSVEIPAWTRFDNTLPKPDEVAFITSTAGGYKAIDSAGTVNFSGPGWTSVSAVNFSIIDPNLCCVLGTDTGFDFMTIDNLTFNVPEPSNVPELSSLLFFAFGLVGLAWGATNTARTIS